ncbi:MAG: hydroxymethylglutaryl-CoA reductase (NADPH) [Planctomycetota bacterium]|jgi:hydroxymethylglutaryl-CoA reductase (NADPH)
MKTSISPIPRSRDNDLSPEVIEARRDLVRGVVGQDLPHVFGQGVAPEETRGNVENFIGFAQVPIGIAGPMLVQTSSGTGQVLVPMATTEGAMVASYSRGMTWLTASGGALTRVVREGLSQHPVLVFDSIAGAQTARDVALSMEREFKSITESITSHGKLVEVSPKVLGRRLVLRLVFTTGDAIGINMAARACDLCAAALAERTQPAERYVHGQDVEKRAHTHGVLEGRGRSVGAEVVVARELLEKKARCTPEAMVKILDTYRVGFAELGTHNQLVQSANGLAALFIATGQDPAYVTESCCGQLDFAVTKSGDLHASVWIPSMLVGTVGGGSGQGTAAECLDLMGCRGNGAANRFAEIAAAMVLAGDLSLMAAFCSHEFVEAHESLGRNRPNGS